MQKSNKKLAIILGVIVILIIGLGISYYFIAHKTKEEATLESVIETETEDTSKSEQEDIYIAIKNKKDIPSSISEDKIIQTEDGAYNVPYNDLVRAAKDKKDYEYQVTDIDGNVLTISVFNFVDSNTGKISLKSFSRKSKTMKEVYTNLDLEEFQKLTRSYSKDEVFEEGYETEVQTHVQEQTSIVHHEHNYQGKVIKNATCTEDGVYQFTCSECQDSYTEPIKALGHQYSSQITKNPTCQEYGIKTYICTICGDKKTEQIPKVGHTWKPMINYTVTCDLCGAQFHSQGDISQAALEWQAHVQTAHNGDINATSTPTSEEGSGEVCIYCGETR